MLGCTHIRQPFAEELPHIILIGGGAAEDLGVSGPAVTLVTLGTVCRNIQIIALLAPDDIAEQLIQHRIAALQPAGALHLRVKYNGPDTVCRKTGRSFVDPQIPESKERKPGLV